MENERPNGFFMGGTNNWYDHYMAQEIELIAAYIEESEISISNAQVDLKKYEKFEIDNPDTHYYSVRSFFRDVDGNTFNLKEIYNDYFPMLTRHSTLVMVMSMFEKKLVDLCDSIQKEYKIDQSIKSFQKKHKGKLLAMKLYLSNEAQLSFGQTLEEYWSQLTVLNSIRNNIVHNFGKYENPNEYVDKFIERNSSIYVSMHNEFMFSNIFLSDLTLLFNDFCREIQISLRTRNED